MALSGHAFILMQMSDFGGKADMARDVRLRYSQQQGSERQIRSTSC
jgi:hypothetical protein